MGMSTFQSQTRFDRDKRFHVNEEDDSKSKHYARIQRGKVEGNLNISLPSKITENIPRNPPCKLKYPLEPPPLPEQNSGCVPEQTYETPSYHCRNFLRYLILCSKTIMTNTDLTSAVFQTLQCPVFLHVSTVFAFFYQEVDNEMEFKP